ncbi:HAD-IA family hydrolase [Sphingorhabdus sp. Alg239-R122]|uniref:HAD family hydrolase n=1 Tax=Sphingorhabdus sp. Alg239-R122 TaxID=2305989 RepID=UPI0013DBB09A|nr:HAD-IA family hydrolase [Sphingorhabdus sp. Alg239-R122]
MANFPFDIVGFDLDGTLLDTSGELTASVNHALAKAGRPPLTQDDVRPMVGLGAKYMLDQGFQKTGVVNADTLKEYLRILLAHYGENLGSSSPPYPGLVNVMDELDAMGVKMAVVTNKFEGFAIKLLTNIGMIDRFSCVIGGDTMGKGFSKPHRAPIDEMVRRCGGGKAVFIGDSIYDVMAAHNADIPAIAVSFGFLHQPVKTLRANHIIDHYDELIPALKQLDASQTFPLANRREDSV